MATGALRKLQALTKDGRPVTLWANGDRIWRQVADGNAKVIKEIR
jgi:hypothetical protein